MYSAIHQYSDRAFTEAMCYVLGDLDEKLFYLLLLKAA